MKAKYSLPKETFILFMDKLFDSYTSSCKNGQKSNPLKGALTVDSEHENFWNESIKLLRRRQI